MTDITTVNAILGSVKAATDIARLLKDTSASLEKAEAKLKLAELISALADAKLELANIQDALLQKDRRIKDLEAVQELKLQLSFANGVYWLLKDGKEDGPYCPQCYDSEGKAIRLQEPHREHWRCMTCDKSFFGKGYSGESAVVVARSDYDPFSY